MFKEDLEVLEEVLSKAVNGNELSNDELNLLLSHGYTEYKNYKGE